MMININDPNNVCYTHGPSNIQRKLRCSNDDANPSHSYWTTNKSENSASLANKMAISEYDCRPDSNFVYPYAPTMMPLLEMKQALSPPKLWFAPPLLAVSLGQSDSLDWTMSDGLAARLKTAMETKRVRIITRLDKVIEGNVKYKN